MIKKFLYGFAIIAGLSSCNDDYTDWENPQSNAANSAAETFVLTVEQKVSSIDFATETAENIQLFTTNLQDGQTDAYTVTFSAEGKSEKPVLTTTDGQVASTDLQNVVASIFGKAPEERTIAVEVAAYVNIETADGVIVAEKKNAPFTIQAKLDAPIISTGYYLIGNMNGWDATNMLDFKFNHSDKDVYEDPIFTLIFTTTGNDQYWKIIPQDNVDANDTWANGVLGVAVDGDAALEGSLVTENPQAGKIEKAGIYRMTLNMMEYTYTIQEITPEYYVVGDMQGWKDNVMTCAFYPQNKMIHSYTTQFNGNANLKIWLGSDFGNWNAAYGSMTDGDNSAGGTLVGNNAGAMVCPEIGMFYTLTIDFSAMTYTWTKLDNQTPAEYEAIGLIGGFCDWGTDVDMTEVTPHNWYYPNFTLTGASEVKFRANDDWADSWGKGVSIADENYGVADYNGANFTVPAGTYNVFFNDITGEYLFKVIE